MIFTNLPTTDLDGEYKLFPKKDLEIKDNSITCFIGCNGSGKTTLVLYLRDYIRKQLKSEEIRTPNRFETAINAVTGREKCDTNHNYYYISFDKSQKDGLPDDYMLANLKIACQSTGESIIYRFGGTLALLGDFVRKPENSGKSVFIFFDDCDAGTSIDLIQDIYDVFHLIADDCTKNKITYYIILTANSYELCRNSDITCIDVNTYKTVEITDYENYKKFVLSSRKKKDARFDNK